MSQLVELDESAPEAEVLIPHWNRAESLRRTLESLRRQTRPCRILVIDNCSTDHTRSMLTGDFPEVHVLRLDMNLGFGAALNRGVAQSEARVVIFLGNDAVADPRFVEEILSAQRATHAEMVAACLRQPDGPVDSLGVEVDRSLIAFDVGHGEPFDSFAAGDIDPPLGPTGGAGAFVREAFLSVGGFDEAFFAYLEDVDLGMRMRMSGMRCVVAPRAFALHEHSATLGSGTRAKNRLMGLGRGYLVWKYGASLGSWARARGALVDAVVYAGQALIDRNVGAPSGRLEAARMLRRRPRPPADPRFPRVPVVKRGIIGTLRRRLARRRPWPTPRGTPGASLRLGAPG